MKGKFQKEKYSDQSWNYGRHDSLIEKWNLIQLFSWLILTSLTWEIAQKLNQISETLPKRLFHNIHNAAGKGLGMTDTPPQESVCCVSEEYPRTLCIWDTRDGCRETIGPMA